LGRVAPQNDPTAFRRTARFQFDDTSVREFDISRRIFSSTKLCAAMRHQGLDIVRSRAVGNVTESHLKANQFFIGAADERFALWERAENVVEVPAAIDEALVGVEQRNCDAQAIERLQKFRRNIDRGRRSACRNRDNLQDNPHLFAGEFGYRALRISCLNSEAGRNRGIIVKNR
jgi:hypothetical protein